FHRAGSGLWRRALLRARHQLRRCLAAGVVALLHRRNEAVGPDRPRRFILRRIPDCQGKPMYTEERLFTYLQQFERDFARSKARIIDATEGGAAKRGTTVMT